MKNAFNKTFLNFVVGFLAIIVMTFALILYIGDEAAVQTVDSHSDTQRAVTE